MSILDWQSFVLHKIGKEFHQECNGGIYIWLVTSYDIVRHHTTLYSTVDIALDSSEL